MTKGEGTGDTRTRGQKARRLIDPHRRLYRLLHRRTTTLSCRRGTGSLDPGGITSCRRGPVQPLVRRDHLNTRLL
jgi:hypothetical protein